MDQFLVYSGPHKLFGGKCLLFRFPNDWGASVVRHQSSKGGIEGFWETALVSFPENDSNNYIIRLDTSLMSNTVGYLFIDEVLELLDQIKSLKQDAKKTEE